MDTVIQYNNFINMNRRNDIMSNKSDILFESLTSRYDLKKDEIKQEIVETRARLKYLYKQLS